MKLVKETFDKGDCKELTDSRQYLLKHWNKDDFMISKAALILNLYQQWGLLNRKDFLPLWGFEGASGIRVDEMTIQLSSSSTKVELITNTVCSKIATMLRHLKT